MANILATVTVELEYDEAVAALANIRNVTLVWPATLDAMTERLRLVNRLAQAALDKVTVRSGPEVGLANSPALVAATREEPTDD